MQALKLTFSFSGHFLSSATGISLTAKLCDFVFSALGISITILSLNTVTYIYTQIHAYRPSTCMWRVTRLGINYLFWQLQLLAPPHFHSRCVQNQHHLLPCVVRATPASSLASYLHPARN